MAEVVQHSTQYLTEDDLAAIARYLKSLPAGQEEPTVAAVASSAPAADSAFAHPRERGIRRILRDLPPRQTASGVAHIFPALTGNDVVETADATSLVHIVLTGGRRPHTAARPNAYAMPGFTQLDDREVAAIITYIRSAWGNSAGSITADQVAKMRPSFQRNAEATATPAPQQRAAGRDGQIDAAAHCRHSG